MELITEQIEIYQKKNRMKTQLTIDDDYIVKDTKPDVMRLIFSSAEIILDEKRVNKDAIWIMGRLNITAMYMSDRTDSGIENLNLEIPFQEKLNMEGVDETDDLDIHLYQEDLSLSIINSRKLSIRALVDVDAFAFCRQEEQLSIDIAEQMEKQKKEEEILYPLERIQWKEKLHNRYEIPASKPNINRILSYIPRLSVTEVMMKERGVVYQGKMTIGVLYESYPEGTYDWYEIDEMFHYETTSENAKESDCVWARVELEQTSLVAATDYDGETRQLQFDYTIGIQGQIYREEKINYLVDMYSLHQEMELQYANCQSMRFLVKNTAKSRLCQQQTIDQGEPKMLAVCMCNGRVELDHIETEQNGIMVEGLLKADVIYMTGADDIVLAATEGQLEYKQFVEMKGLNENSEFFVQPSLESLQINLLDHNNYEVMAVISIMVFAYDRISLKNIRNFECLESVSMDFEPGIIGYTVKEGDSLWDIAKKYRCTVADLQKTNDLQGEQILPNEKLLVVKFL